MNHGREWTPGSLGALGLGVGSLTAALILFVFQLSGRFDTIVYISPDSGSVFNVSAILAPTSEASTPVATPVVPPDPAAIARLVIPKIQVDANVVVKGVGADGYMETPDNGYDVAWYDFSSRPGAAGNAVFSGHVDYYKIGAAVFWNLGKLQPDDEIDVRLADGNVYRYAVVGKGAFDENSVPVEQIVGQTPGEVITLITCTGTFDRTTRDYNERLVVRAKRIVDSVPAGASGVTTDAGR